MPPSKSSSCDCSCGPMCKVVHVVVIVLLVVVTLAALTGVYMAHVLPTGLTFGTSTGSLSIIAFVMSFMVTMKKLKHGCCGGCCQK